MNQQGVIGQRVINKKQAQRRYAGRMVRLQMMSQAFLLPLQEALADFKKGVLVIFMRLQCAWNFPRLLQCR
jgi:hypothetical protein